MLGQEVSNHLRHLLQGGLQVDSRPHGAFLSFPPTALSTGAQTLCPRSPDWGAQLSSWGIPTHFLAGVLLPFHSIQAGKAMEKYLGSREQRFWGPREAEVGSAQALGCQRGPDALSWVT